MFSSGFQPGKGPIFLSELDCTGSENSLFDCNTFSFSSLHNCTHSQDIIVMCDCEYFNCAIVFIVLLYYYIYTASCPELYEETLFGTYLWPSDVVANETKSMLCANNCSERILNRMVTKMCDQSGHWIDTTFSQCPSEQTCQLLDQFEVCLFFVIVLYIWNCFVLTYLVN